MRELPFLLQDEGPEDFCRGRGKDTKQQRVLERPPPRAPQTAEQGRRRQQHSREKVGKTEGWGRTGGQRSGGRTGGQRGGAHWGAFPQNRQGWRVQSRGESRWQQRAGDGELRLP